MLQWVGWAKAALRRRDEHRRRSPPGFDNLEQGMESDVAVGQMENCQQRETSLWEGTTMKMQHLQWLPPEREQTTRRRALVSAAAAAVVLQWRVASAYESCFASHFQLMKQHFVIPPIASSEDRHRRFVLSAKQRAGCGWFDEWKKMAQGVAVAEDRSKGRPCRRDFRP